MFGQKKNHFQIISNGIDEKPVLKGVKAGALCPKCKSGMLDYDGMLNIVCPNCGFTAGGCFT